MTKEIVNRKEEGFILSDSDPILSKGDIVVIIKDDGSSTDELIVDSTRVSGMVGKPNFIKYVTGLVKGKNGETVKILPGQRVKYIGGDDEIEVY